MKYKKSSEIKGVDPKPAGFVLKNPAHSTLAHVAGFIPPMLSHDCSPPGSSVHGILQARILEWVAIFFSRGSS